MCHSDTVFRLICREVHEKTTFNRAAIQKKTEFTMRMKLHAKPFKSCTRAPWGPELRPRQTESPGTCLRELPEKGKSMHICAMGSSMQVGKGVDALTPD